MKDRSDIKTILGLTQIEMSMLLGISRSMWTMFKSGKRNIPLASKELLAYYMDTATRNKPSKEAEKISKEEQVKAKQQLYRDLKNTEVKIEQLRNEIATFIRIRKQLYAGIETAVVLNTDKNTKNAKPLAKSIESRVHNSFKKYNLGALQTLELKKESLEMLKFKIEKKLKS